MISAPAIGYDGVKQRINAVFQLAKVEIPTELREIIVAIDALGKDVSITGIHNENTFIQPAIFTQAQILLLKLSELRSQVQEDKNAIDNKQFDKLIELYDALLQNYGLGPKNPQADQNFHQNMLPYRDKIDEALKLQSPFTPECKEFLGKIKAMRRYGEALLSNKHQEGKMMCDFAGIMENKAKAFFAKSDPEIEQGFVEFQQKIAEDLRNLKIHASKYRVNVKTLALNILAALSVVGLIFIGARLAISSMKPKGHTFMDKLKEGRALLLFAKPTTTREDLVEKVENSFRSIPAPGQSK